MTLSRVLSLAVLTAVASIPAANAQFGGMPGMGDPGLGGPPAGPPPACQQLLVLRDEREKNNTAIRALAEKARAQLKPPDPVELCKLFKVYLVTEDNFVKGLTDNQTTCGVPPQVVQRAHEARDKATQIGKQFCEAAARAPEPSQPSFIGDSAEPAPGAPAYGPYFLDHDGRPRGIRCALLPCSRQN
jgi:hypothetical protein